VIYKMGGWAPPHGISLYIDALNAPLIVLIAVMAVITLIYAAPATAAEVKPNKRAPFYSAYLLCVAGLLGMVVTGDAFNVFVFLEVSSIATYVLVAMGSARDRRALTLMFVLVGLGVVGMIFASLQAIFQTDVRRMLAFSSVAQVGYMLLGIGIATTASVAAGYLHLLNHAIIKAGLFLALGAMWYRFGITRAEDFRGLGKTMPWTMGAFTVSGLSLIGVPFTAGFVSKINLAVAAWDAGWVWAVGVIMIASILALIYVGRVLLLAYFQSPPEINGQVVAKNEAPLAMLVPMWGLALASIFVGVESDAIVGAATRAAELLLGAG